MFLVDWIYNSGVIVVYVLDDELVIGILDGLLDCGVKVLEEFEIIISNNFLLIEVVCFCLISII